ncbi:phosphonate C-P lyase system protein PhnH [Stutzerimonas azotifigens]|uniref:Phosphonate C-P lyase system protein PhnH n=1 Tax=Stutzerimonas azotifigens TaxID=291995 RepID=A0ABR5YZK1_9GAMM|nr:phosphonate C-P lyase system protein PhnH [Stutzerimonas azotifigens]MBA1273344.1 phosphonate C-P lyase system protein PhnH [Stutzerimonas azotifigens]
MSDAPYLQPAFERPAEAAQQTFRAALRALAEPGLARPLPPTPTLERLAPATYALCLSLLDADTPVWLAPAFDTPVVRANLSFHCGCPVVERREQAAFAVLDAGDLADLSGFPLGSERYPDQSCTLLVQLERLDGGEPVAWQGPGIAGQRQVDLPLPGHFWKQRDLNGDFPRGLDVFFTAGQALLGLPRSTRCLAPIREAS